MSAFTSDDDAPCPTRRELLTAAVGLAVVGCAKGTEKWETKAIAADEGMVELDIADYPELVTPGNMLALRPEGTRETILVMRLENDQFRILSMECPHLGCTVRWDNVEQDLRCPCHGSRFDDTGAVLHGPAKRSLTQYPFRVDGTRLQFKIET